MKKVNVTQIAKDIESLIKQQVNELTYDDNAKWKDKYNNAIAELDYEIENAKSLIEDYSKNELKINSVEQEGFLRALITMRNVFKNV